MRSVGAYEAKTHLPRLLKDVANGETITITKHGVPVALLSPPRRTVPAELGRAIASLRAFRARHGLGDASIRDLIDEGRR
jgi:prevent-host-death family protein